MFVTPAVAGTTVYAGSCAGVYYAFDLTTGNIRWSHDFKPTAGHATFHGDPLLTGRVLVTGTEALDPPRAYAFDPATGDILWQRSDRFALTRSDVIGLDDLAIGRNDAGELVALDIASGEFRWHVSHEGRRFRPDVAESPAIADSDVVFSAPDGAIYRVHGRSGDVLWRRPVQCDVTSSVTVRDADVYVGCREGRLFRLDAADGETRSTIDLPASVDGRLTVTDSRVIVPGGHGWIGAVDRGTREMEWEYRPPPGVRLSVVQPLLWQGVLLTGTGEGRLVALDAATGSVRWTAQLDGQIRGLGQHGDVLLVGTIEGVLYALDARSLNWPEPPDRARGLSGQP